MAPRLFLFSRWRCVEGRNPFSSGIQMISALVAAAPTFLPIVHLHFLCLCVIRKKIQPTADNSVVSPLCAVSCKNARFGRGWDRTARWGTCTHFFSPCFPLIVFPRRQHCVASNVAYRQHRQTLPFKGTHAHRDTVTQAQILFHL